MERISQLCYQKSLESMAIRLKPQESRFESKEWLEGTLKRLSFGLEPTHFIGINP